MASEISGKCALCGKRFTASGKGSTRRRYCSHRCQVDANNARRRAERGSKVITRSCAICGTSFTAVGTSNRKLTCSGECGRELHARRSRDWAAKNYVPLKNPRAKRRCEVCRKWYQPVRDNQVYCGPFCRRRGTQEKKVEARRVQRVCIRCGTAVETKPGVPVCADCRADKRNRTEYYRLTTLRVYGLDPDTFDRMLRSQRGRCAICRTSDPGGKGWCVDHDHATGATRGILCTQCNNGLGQFADDVKRLDAAKRYLLASRSRKKA